MTRSVPPPRFNSLPQVRLRDERGDLIDSPDTPALEEIHACEYSSTGYFGNEGSDSRFYVYAALQIEVGSAGKRETAERAGAKAGPIRKATTKVAPKKPSLSVAKAKAKVARKAPKKEAPKKEVPIKKWTWRF